MRKLLNGLGNAAIAIIYAALFTWVALNAMTGCSRLDPDACVAAPWIGQ